MKFDPSRSIRRLWIFFLLVGALAGTVSFARWGLLSALTPRAPLEAQLVTKTQALNLSRQSPQWPTPESIAEQRSLLGGLNIMGMGSSGPPGWPDAIDPAPDIEIAKDFALIKNWGRNIEDARQRVWLLVLILLLIASLFVFPLVGRSRTEVIGLVIPIVQFFFAARILWELTDILEQRHFSPVARIPAPVA